jgi:hypothetical protein
VDFKIVMKDCYSHNPEADMTRPVGRPEGVEILNTVLEFIREVEPQVGVPIEFERYRAIPQISSQVGT